MELMTAAENFMIAMGKTDIEKMKEYADLTMQGIYARYTKYDIDPDYHARHLMLFLITRVRTMLDDKSTISDATMTCIKEVSDPCISILKAYDAESHSIKLPDNTMDFISLLASMKIVHVFLLKNPDTDPFVLLSDDVRKLIR